MPESKAVLLFVWQTKRKGICAEGQLEQTGNSPCFPATARGNLPRRAAGQGTDPAGVRPVKGEFCQMGDLGRWLGQLHPVWIGGEDWRSAFR